MSKTIFITGSTDGIGLETAKDFVSKGHHVILHGRSKNKLLKVEEELSKLGSVDSFIADLSDLNAVNKMSDSILEKYKSIDVLINNAGVYKTGSPIVKGYDIRFTVNTVAPYLITKKLLPSLKKGSRVINLSSAAQDTVEVEALLGNIKLSDFDAYAQSKLAIVMWSFDMAYKHKDLTIIAVNPASLLGTKMVKEGFDTDGKDIGIGVRILLALSLDQKYKSDSGKYFDNDSGRFTSPHPDGLSEENISKVVETIESIIKKEVK